MTNSEAIKLLNQEKIPMILDGKPNEHLAVAHIKAIEALEENDKLKAEAEQLKEDYSVLERQYNNVENSSIRYYNEVKQLKSELEQSVRLPCKVGDKYILIFNEYGELFKTIGWELTEITIIADDILLDFYCFSTEESEQRSLDSFRKTIFNTEEEAEQHLKGKVKE